MPTVKQLRTMAGNMGLKKVVRLSKPDLIRAIQTAEGHSACFQNIPGCGQMDCLFRLDCLTPSPEVRA